MFNPINTQFLSISKNLMDTAFKAQHLAIESMERMTEMNLKAFENNVNASVAFWTEASEARDFDGVKAMWPKGVSLVKASTEKMYSNGQEAIGLGMKTSEALSNLAKGAFEATNDSLNMANSSKKAAASK